MNFNSFGMLHSLEGKREREEKRERERERREERERERESQITIKFFFNKVMSHALME